MNKVVFFLGVSLLLVLASARASDVTRVYDVLDRLPSGDRDAGFNAWINEGGANQFILGDEIAFNFNSETDLYVSIAYIDSHGVLSLLQPEIGGKGNLLKSGVVSTFPAPNSGLRIEIEPPLGTERIYFIGSRNAVDRAVFESEANTGGDRSALFQTADSVKLAQDYVASLLNNNTPEEISVVAVDNKILERTEGPQYTKREIVSYFSKRGSRAITRPKLDANIRFETNSAILSEEAKRNLDVWGESFLHPFLSDSEFQIGGHTDDVGAESYNLDLSQKRAEAVRRYLAEKFRIEQERFSVVGHGESEPKVDNTDADARAENRRVEFRQINDKKS